MAVARITQTFDECSISVQVEVTDSYPQCVAEAVAQVITLWRETVPDVSDE